jgi:hypothetical protein
LLDKFPTPFLFLLDISFHSSEITLAESVDEVISITVFFLPSPLTRFFDDQVKLSVKMHTFIAHIVVFRTQPHPASVIL